MLVAQVALAGLRRRRGIEGMAESDTQLAADLVAELMVPPDATWHVLERCARPHGDDLDCVNWSHH